MSIVEIKVPDIGGHDNVDVIAVEVKAGDTIALDQTLITLETDKATMDVPSTAAGLSLSSASISSAARCAIACAESRMTSCTMMSSLTQRLVVLSLLISESRYMLERL